MLYRRRFEKPYGRELIKIHLEGKTGKRMNIQPEEETEVCSSAKEITRHLQVPLDLSCLRRD